MVASPLDREGALAVLGTVMDPEVPVISVVDLGIVREVRVRDAHVDVDVTPTYSGCPAMHAIESDIRAALHGAGAHSVDVRTVFQPAWTTDWMSDSARERLREYGIAPPQRADTSESLVPLRRRETVPCPFCGSHRTEWRSAFGSTACKALMTCADCRQPFEYFKAI